MEKKISTPAEFLCKGYPNELGTFINYAKSLKFEEKPDYKLLKKPCQFKEETDTKQIFSKDLLPEKIDVLVLGAGASGLAAASTLAKLGKKVVVLE